MTTNLTPQIPKGKEIVLVPEDVYEVGILDIKDRERTKYKSKDKEEVMMFVFTILDGEHAGVELPQFISPSLFAGGNNLNPSKLYQILSAVHKKPLDEEDLMGITIEDINALIGKNLRVAVKQYTTSKGELRNKIDSFLTSKRK